MNEKNFNLDELEREYQATAITNPPVSELFSLDRRYYSYLEEKNKQNPHDIQTLIHLGMLSWEPFHKQEKAIEYLEKAIEYDPNNVEARFWLAKCYYHDYCDYERVKKILLEALSIDPQRADCLDLLSGVIRDMSEDWKEAIKYAEKAILYAPDWPMLRASLAELYLKIKDTDKAEFQIQQAFVHFKPLATYPKNFVEDYYEGIVTGRSWTNLSKEFANIKTSIEKAKTDRIKDSSV